MTSTDLARDRQALRLATRSLAGHGPTHPAAELERVAKHLREHDLAADVYGAGAVLADFEAEVAALFGKPAARYMPSGCMAQPIALRIWAEHKSNFTTAFHPTSHLELHEEHGYKALHGLEAHLLGHPDRPTLARDLDGLPKLSSLLVELPAREIGGQLPSWSELVELTHTARERGIYLHLDGARIWEAQVAYDRPFTELGALFDSIYVSFYKGIGALAGAMLLGPEDFIVEAATWQRRQGGTLYSNLAHIVSAHTRLARQLTRLPLFHARAQPVAALWRAHKEVRVFPDPPQVNMFHLQIAGEVEALLDARDRVAEETGIWLFGGLRPDGDGLCRTELTMGEASLALEDNELANAIGLLFE
jgi:threonine aldolase